MAELKPKEEIKYLKISELEINKYYTCELSGNKVFVKEIYNDDNNCYAWCRCYANGDYYENYFNDYMLY